MLKTPKEGLFDFWKGFCWRFWGRLCPRWRLVGLRATRVWVRPSYGFSGGSGTDFLSFETKRRWTNSLNSVRQSELRNHVSNIVDGNPELVEISCERLSSQTAFLRCIYRLYHFRVITLSYGTVFSLSPEKARATRTLPGTRSSPQPNFADQRVRNKRKHASHEGLY